jgi:hypothetical protein
MHKTLLAASLLLGLVGCTRTVEPQPAPPAQVAAELATPAGLHLAPAPSAICLLQWQCDATQRWFTSQATCRANCAGSICIHDYNCNGHCVCP